MSVTLLFAGPVRAKPVEVEVCKEIIEEVFIPPTYKEVVSCDASAGECIASFLFGVPQCCLPGCEAFPECRVVEVVVDVAGHWVENHEMECKPEWQEPAEEFTKWLKGMIPSLDDALLPGARQVAKYDVALMETRAERVQEHVRQAVRELIQPIKSDAKFSDVDIERARIISAKDPTAGLYLRNGFSAITLDNLIIMEDELFRALKAPPSKRTSAQAVAGGLAEAGYRSAVAVLIHELVHVHQYAALGRDLFIDQYIFEAIVKGYAAISFEKAAYGFEFAVTASWTAPASTHVEKSITSDVEARIQMSKCWQLFRALGQGGASGQKPKKLPPEVAECVKRVSATFHLSRARISQSYGFLIDGSGKRATRGILDKGKREPSKRWTKEFKRPPEWRRTFEEGSKR